GPVGITAARRSASLYRRSGEHVPYQEGAGPARLPRRRGRDAPPRQAGRAPVAPQPR
ncbi:MAG: hypothetical protein AVDCRST_MAG05-745, partial [uncultured Rubrobacteraceae bacterium]